MRTLTRRLIPCGALTLLLVLVAAAVAPAAGSPPELIQLSYYEGFRDQGPDRGLEAYARHTHAMRFATSFRGRTAHAPGRHIDAITDTDIHGHQAKHPWMPNRKEGGRKIYRLVHQSLHKRGFAMVRLRARKSGEHVSLPVRIDLSECTEGPPGYGVGCEIRL